MNSTPTITLGLQLRSHPRVQLLPAPTRRDLPQVMLYAAAFSPEALVLLDPDGKPISAEALANWLWYEDPIEGARVLSDIERCGLVARRDDGALEFDWRLFESLQKSAEAVRASKKRRRAQAAGHRPVTVTDGARVPGQRPVTVTDVVSPPGHRPVNVTDGAVVTGQRPVTVTDVVTAPGHRHAHVHVHDHVPLHGSIDASCIGENGGGEEGAEPPRRSSGALRRPRPAAALKTEDRPQVFRSQVRDMWNRIVFAACEALGPASLTPSQESKLDRFIAVATTRAERDRTDPESLIIRYFDTIARTPFLRGEAQAHGDKRTFKANFAWSIGAQRRSGEFIADDKLDERIQKILIGWYSPESSGGDPRYSDGELEAPPPQRASPPKAPPPSRTDEGPQLGFEDFDPKLLEWCEKNSPDTYQRILRSRSPQAPYRARVRVIRPAPASQMALGLSEVA